MAPVANRSSKKRPAPSHAGPATKKPHLAKAKAPPPDKKRSRPITATVRDDSGSESGLDEEGEFGEDGDEEKMIEEDQMNIDPKPEKVQTGQSARESHKIQRELLTQRRAAKPHSDLLTNAKRIWLDARQKNIPTDQRQKHIKELMNVIRGKVKDIVFKHDASRIVQTVVKWGKQKERDEVAEELKGNFKTLAQSKYSKFLVTKLVRLCPNHRPSILLEFQGSVVRLLLHREASSVIADAYELYANAYERSILLRDFYGKEARLFSVTSGSDVDREMAKKGLKGVLEAAVGAESKKRILGEVKEGLVNIYNNSDKGAVTHAIVHHALWEYLREVEELEDEAEREKLRREMFETCQDVLVEMVHTRDGSRVVREFIARGTAKDRKQIMKLIKPHIERMCKDDEAQLVLFTALDVLDDTKLLTKSLISEITSHASTLCTTHQGRRALLYLILPRSRRHFTPAQTALLAETDEVKKGTSKKDDEVRREEVRKGGSEGLIRWIEESGVEVSRDTGGSLVVGDVMLFAEGDKTAATEALLRSLCTPYPSPDPSNPHPIDLPHISRLYKTLLQGGHFDHSTSIISRSLYFSPKEFASAFVKVVGEDVTVAMAKGGGGTFLVAELLERVRAEGSEDEKKLVKAWFGEGVVGEIERGDVKGKKVLLEKIQALR
ncbi:hypothetical protein JAAARDRAFT_71318 [Jaapia argillacea MUCL 33604]|uniref:PUM-HD domain-containing protein n=1 Tax=Jaapia argillacea MUCL 33604 TaxID=933084 RepID=A0A067PW28_9AGAM|nr:hypothetical protein JAAARDRAFT_71318 [Jaapia argillacea MUCL 33604]